MKKKLAISIIIFTVMAVLTACSAGKTETAGQKEAAGQEEDAGQKEAAGQEDSGQKEAAGQEETAGQEEAVEQKGADSAKAAISFETTDLDGNVIKSADLFKGHRLTMVNIWGTFCGPCIDEMPELEKLNHRLKQKDCAIVGIVCDVESPEDSETIGAAKSLIDEIGVKYTNLIPWEDSFDLFPAEYVPTSYFVDEKGQIVGEAAVGARSADNYEELIDELLK